MSKKISRRHFFNKSFGLGAGALFLKDFPTWRLGGNGKIPIIVTSHSNETGKKAVEGF